MEILSAFLFSQSSISIVVSETLLWLFIGKKSSVASYLVEKCGLSSKSAMSAAKYGRYFTPERADTALSFFADLGFSKSQLSKLVQRSPLLISQPNAQKLFMPKIELLNSKGLSGTELIQTLSRSPTILRRSLHRYIIPHFDYLKALLGSDYKVIVSLKRYSDLFNENPRSNFEPNVALLKQHGLPQSGIMYMLSQQPRILFLRTDKFKIVMEEVIKIGVDPSKFTFAMAFQAKMSMSKSTWERKFDVYKRWGLSKEDILRAFAKNPRCMTISEEKLEVVMDTYVNKLGFDSLVIISTSMTGYSFKKRIIPRSSVIQVLLSKGLIHKSKITCTPFMCYEELFLKKYVTKYEKEVPNLSKIYKEQLQLGSTEIVTSNV
ncbi:hypothetical protein ACFE04_015585 [Oxalis oulophora]